MSEIVRSLAILSAEIVELLGVSLVVLIAIYALLRAIGELLQKQQAESVFQSARLNLGRGILLGLEFLVAADIIYTVALDLTFESVGTLAIIILIRTFLSFTLEVELTGRWPWHNKGE